MEDLGLARSARVTVELAERATSPWSKTSFSRCSSPEVQKRDSKVPYRLGKLITMFYGLWSSLGTPFAVFGGRLCHTCTG